MSKIKIIACESMKDDLLYLNSSEDIEFEFVPMGLHLHPEKLKKELQERLNNSNGYSRIIFAFGLCGGAMKGLKATAQLIIPKVHDCVPLFLGSSRKFSEIQSKCTGTFYLSNGLLKGDESMNLFKEHNRISAKFGPKKAEKLVKRMFGNYTQVLYIKTEFKDDDESVKESKRISEILDLDYSVIHGENTYMNKIINGPWNEDEFVIVNEGEIVSEEMFGI